MTKYEDLPGLRSSFVATSTPCQPPFCGVHRSGESGLRRKLQWAEIEREAGRSTVPPLLAKSGHTTPFLRLNSPAVRNAVGANNSIHEAVVADGAPRKGCLLEVIG